MDTGGSWVAPIKKAFRWMIGGKQARLTPTLSDTAPLLGNFYGLTLAIASIRSLINGVLP